LVNILFIFKATISKPINYIAKILKDYEQYHQE